MLATVYAAVPALSINSFNSVCLLGEYETVPELTTSVNPITVNTKHLYNTCTMFVQRRRRWADVVHMLYKCFVFAGIL